MARTTCMVLSVAVLMSALVPPSEASAAEGSITLGGNEYYDIIGEIAPSVRYPGVGVLLSPNDDVDGCAYYRFFVDSHRTYHFSVTMLYTDNSLLGDGPDIEIFNWTSMNWDKIVTKLSKGTDLYGVASPTDRGIENYMSFSGQVAVEAYAEPLDETDVGSITLSWSYDDTPPANPTSFTAVPSAGTWTNDSTVEIEWSGAFDDHTDIGGYSIQWTQSQTTIPDAVADTTTTSSTSPILADGDWYFHVRTRDGAGNWNASAYHAGPLRIDTTAPSTLSTISGTAGSNGWYVSPVTVSLISDDSASGNAAILFRIDSGGWQTYGSSFAHSVGGDHLLQYYATDHAGNSEPVKSTRLKIDMTAPVTYCVLSGDQVAQWFISPVKLELHSSDADSEVNWTRFRINGARELEYRWPFNVTGEGECVVEFYSQDFAGLTEHVETATFKMDMTAPSLVIDLANNTKFTSTPVTIAWSSADATSGVNLTECRLDGGTWTICSGDSIGWARLENGVHQLDIRVTDEAGNHVVRSVTFRVNTDMFSPSGPVGPWLDIGVVAAVVLLSLLLALSLRRRRRGSKLSEQEGPT